MNVFTRDRQKILEVPAASRPRAARPHGRNDWANRSTRPTYSRAAIGVPRASPRDGARRSSRSRGRPPGKVTNLHAARAARTALISRSADTGFSSTARTSNSNALLASSSVIPPE